MKDVDSQRYTAFEGARILIQGRLDEVALHVKQRLKSDDTASILVFSDLTGKQMDFDLRGSEKDVRQRLQVYLSTEPKASPPTGPGRPKLGVVAREVSLLPRHWEWLSTQSGGASATLRRIVDDARKGAAASGKEALKQAQERTHRFMSAIAGDLPRFEEALRALYAKDRKKFGAQIADWPTDIREHCQSLAGSAFD